MWNSGLREEAGSLIYVLRKLASEGKVIERVIRLLQSLIRDEDLSFFISWLSFYRRLLSLSLDVWNSVLREEAGFLIYDSFMFFISLRARIVKRN